MERTTTAVALAIAMSLTAALSAVPVQAVDADCTKDFDIADSLALAQSRELNPGENETGVEDVADTEADQKVTIDLETDNSKLEFGVFEESPDCDRSSNVSDSCLQDVVLDTTGSQKSTDSQTCTIESPNDGTRKFFFGMENIGDVTLEYRIYVST